MFTYTHTVVHTHTKQIGGKDMSTSFFSFFGRQTNGSHVATKITVIWSRTKAQVSTQILQNANHIKRDKI